MAIAHMAALPKPPVAAVVKLHAESLNASVVKISRLSIPPAANS